jgi:hypothetical protein
MALETVNADRCIGMAAVAEVSVAVDTWCIGGIADMTVYTFVQAVLLGADPFVHGRITLMEKVLHVVGTHILGWLDAALFIAVASLRLWDIGASTRFLIRVGITCQAGCVNTQQQAGYQSNETVFNHVSMIRG